jgi:CRISPR-associated protein Csb1
MPESISLSQLQSALSGSAAAFRSITKLQPVGGEGDKIFPATYAGGVYATEKRRLAPGADLVDCVLVNSVQSEANHAELALKQAIGRGEIQLPLIEADFSGCSDFRKPLPNLTSLEVPHRLADAILRDCSLPDGTPFSQSAHARSWGRANLWNATPIFEICPTALVFGMWGSPEKPGGLGAKFERAYVSEVVAVNAIINEEMRAGFRIDPIEVSKGVAVKKTDSGFQLVEAKAKGALRPSEINHGNIVFESKNSGIRCEYVEQTTVVSLGALRKLQFPIDGAHSPERDHAARVVLAAIGLCAGVLAAERGTSLRSRCHLVPTEPRAWRLVDIPGRPQPEFEITGPDAVVLLNAAVGAAVAVGLPWMRETLTLTPTAELVELIRQSQEFMAKESGEGESQ